jgi:hypothetical protein
MPNYRTLTPDQLFKWAENNRQVMRLRTDSDILPGGYMAALAPMLAAWNDSDYDRDDGFLILRNVNYGGNSFERTTVLQSVRVPLDGLEAAELTLVPSTALGLRSPVHHVQLRFIFTPGNGPELLNLAGAETGTDAGFPDLVFSWESWRPPNQAFSLKQGLDETAYGLSMRAFAGPQRYLEDTIRGHDWYSWRLGLPGGRAGVRELFMVSVVLGDGVAREGIHRLLEQGQEAWLAHAPQGDDAKEQVPPSVPGSAPAVWQRLATRLRAATPPADSAAPLPDDEQTYHVLVRSCAALARYAILVATNRLVARGETGRVVADKLPAPELDRTEPWMKAVARADLRGLFLHAPAAIGFLTRNPSLIPGKLPDELDAAGLLQQRGGKPWVIRYGRDALRPYGSDGLNQAEVT